MFLYFVLLSLLCDNNFSHPNIGLANKYAILLQVSLVFKFKLERFKKKSLMLVILMMVMMVR